MRKFFLPALLFSIVLTAFTLQEKKKPAEYLSVPGPLKFNNITYSLAWSSHPNEHYYRQMYIPAGDTVETYKKLILLEFLTNGLEAEDVSGTQSTMIEVRKKADTLARYSVTKNAKTGEIVLDFLISESDDEAVQMVEWNAYRYKNIKEKSGKKGVLLFAVSMRAYGKDIKEFLNTLKTSKPKLISALNLYKLPELNINK